MKAKDWIYVAAAIAAFVLGALLFRGCQKPEVKTVEVVKYLPVNLDSLKATIEPVKVEVPGPERQVLRYVTVTVTNQEQADSLAKAYAELANRYSQLEAELQWGWFQGEGAPFDISPPRYMYTDSVTTADYFHRWEIVAEGPVVSYTPQIVPFCPPPPTLKPAKMHRAGGFVGAQTTTGGVFRPAFGAKYSWGGLSVHGAYLPRTGTDQPAFQLLTGFEIPFR